MIFLREAKEEFNIAPISSEEMDRFVERCMNVYEATPEWLTPLDEDLKTVNFAKSVCSEAARLATLAVGIKLDGGVRAKWLQEQMERSYFNLRHWVEYGAAAGTVILKPNGNGIDCITPDRFKVTAAQGGEITGAVFVDQFFDSAANKWYTRLEHHRFEGEGDDRTYIISNRCYVGDTKTNGKRVDIKKTPWSELDEDVIAHNVERPLFGVFRMPAANNIDIDSPLGMPLFSEALEELRDLDVAYSLNAAEIEDSRRIVLLDSDRVMMNDGMRASPMAFENGRSRLSLPKYVRIVNGSDNGDVYHEINPDLNTDARLSGINALLSQIGFKCGFSNGYFVFNEKTGMVTATQVEADDRRTIQLVKDIRDKLESALDGLLYAMDKFADAYGLAPVGTYEAHYAFGDITYSYEEDRARWLSYAQSGRVPFWYYLVKFENMTEEEARALVDQTATKETLFGASE